MENMETIDSENTPYARYLFFVFIQKKIDSETFCDMI